MRHGRQKTLLEWALPTLLLLLPAAVQAQGNGTLDLGSLLRERDPEALLASVRGDAQKQIKDGWMKQLYEDSQNAASRNDRLYSNPSLQAYVNRLGQSLIPREAAENIFVTFRIIEDPLPYAETMATGAVYLSSGLISLLDNESQLAFVLLHEAGHVVLSHSLYEHIEEEKARRKSAVVTGIATLIGGGLGRAIGGTKGAAEGAGAGFVAAQVSTAIQRHRFVREEQLESDQFAIQILLDHGFDAREAPALMLKIGRCLRGSGAIAEMAFGDTATLVERSEAVEHIPAHEHAMKLDQIDGLSIQIQGTVEL